MKYIFDQPRVQLFLANHNILWHFNIEKAPWQGGFYERMVKSVKRCFRKTLRNAKLSFEELMTILTEIESTINSRPLTFVSSEELEEPLMPSHLICGKRLCCLPDVNNELDPNEDYVEDVTTGTLTKRMKYVMYLLSHFWNRWNKEYLVELREYYRNRSKSGTIAVAVGDIVTVKGENLPRGHWMVGKIEKLIESKDKQVRGAVVKVCTKGKRPMTIRRPVQHLYPLEFQETMDRKPDYLPGEENTIEKNIPEDDFEKAGTNN